MSRLLADAGDWLRQHPPAPRPSAAELRRRAAARSQRRTAVSAATVVAVGVGGLATVARRGPERGAPAATANAPSPAPPATADSASPAPEPTQPAPVGTAAPQPLPPTTAGDTDPTGDVERIAQLVPPADYTGPVWDATELRIAQCMADADLEYRSRPNPADPAVPPVQAGTAPSTTAGVPAPTAYTGDPDQRWLAWQLWHDAQLMANADFEPTLSSCTRAATTAVTGEVDAQAMAADLADRIATDVDIADPAAVDTWFETHPGEFAALQAEYADDLARALFILDHDGEIPASTPTLPGDLTFGEGTVAPPTTSGGVGPADVPLVPGPTTPGESPGTLGELDVVEILVTVPLGSELSYWRMLPDLDLAFRATSAFTTEICWRTPAGSGCIDDDIASPNVGIIPTSGGMIILAGPGLVAIDPPPSDSSAPPFELGPDPTTVVATLSNGTTTTADIEHVDGIGIGYARIHTPDGTRVIRANSQTP